LQASIVGQKQDSFLKKPQHYSKKKESEMNLTQ